MRKWFSDNIIAIVLVIMFIQIFLITQSNDMLLEYIGTTSIEYLNNEYYRWFTCIFYHYNITHIFFNSLALLCVGSILSPFIGKWKTLIIFILGGVLAEIPFSLIVNYESVSYGGGSSGGIFALIATFIVCYLRFPNELKLKWYRLDLLVVWVYLILANDNQSSFLTHSFGFIAGVLLATILVVFKVIRNDNMKQNTALLN